MEPVTEQIVYVWHTTVRQTDLTYYGENQFSFQLEGMSVIFYLGKDVPPPALNEGDRVRITITKEPSDVPNRT